MLSCVWIVYRENIVVMDMSTVCKYYLRKGDLFALSWTRV